MRRSIRNINILPPGIPRAFDCASCPGRGEFELCVDWVGNLNPIYLLFWRNTPVSFFPFLQSLTDLQDRISPLLVNSFKRVFKRSLGGVITAYLSEKRVVFDWRRNLSLSRGIAVQIGGAFERLFAPRGGNLKKPIFKSSYARGVARGGDVELSNWLVHNKHLFNK